MNVEVSVEPSRLEAARRRFFRRLQQRTAWSADIAVGVLMILDFSAVVLAGVLSDVINTPGQTRLTNHLAGSALAAIAVIQGSNQFKLYDPTFVSRPLPMIDRVLTAVTASFGVLALMAYLAELPSAYPSAWKIGLFVSSLILIVGFRLLFGYAVTTMGVGQLLARHVVVVGAGAQGEAVLEQLEQQACPWTRVLCVFDDRARDPTARVPRKLRGRYPVMGTTRDLVSFARKVRVDEVFVALPWTSEARISQVLSTLQVVPANVHLWPDVLRSSQSIRKLSTLGGMSVVTMASKPISGWGYLAKLLLDKTLASIGLLLLTPFMLLVAVVIKLDSRGPVFFRQPRLGFNNKVIHVYKFRSMAHDRADAAAETLVTRSDPRITRVGRIIRRLSIDELPQLLNVLRGDMSLVGPRPHALRAKAAGSLYQDLVVEYALRHKMKPGITGWAQVSGWRGETDTAEKIIRRVDYDLFYMNNWSIIFDLYILVLTALKVPFHRNAY